VGGIGEVEGESQGGGCSWKGKHSVWSHCCRRATATPPSSSGRPRPTSISGKAAA